MKKTQRRACRAVAVLFLVALTSCGSPSLEEEVAELPELPPDVAATLDPETMTTKAAFELQPPESPPEAAAAAAGPCCSSEQTRKLKVRFPYTKCGPLVFDFADALFLQRRQRDDAGPTLFKLSELQGKRLARVNICYSGQGPWDAVLQESRACSPFTPIYHLTISALGDAIPFQWSGFQTPPANVQIVGCRTFGTTRLLCPNALSTCSCLASPCEVEAACQCPLDWPQPS